MHLIIILIRWLVGLLFGDKLVRGAWPCTSGESGTFRFQHDSNAVFRSILGRMKVRLMLAGFIGPLGWSPARVVVSPNHRGFLRADLYQPDYSVWETALISTNFPPPVPHCWGRWCSEKESRERPGAYPPKIGCSSLFF